MLEETREELLEKLDAQIERKRMELAHLEITKRCLLELNGEEGEETISKTDFAQHPRTERFGAMSQAEALEVVLREVAPQPMHIKKIARLMVKNGYGAGKKTSKQIKGSITAILSKGAKAGKFKNESRGYWSIVGNQNEEQ